MPELMLPNRPSRRPLARWALILAAASVLGGSVVLLAGASRRQPADRSAVELDLASGTVMNFDVTVTAVGELEARQQIEIRNQLEQPTTIVDIVKEGTVVKQGDILVRLNSDAIQTQIDEESLRVGTARADLSVAENAYEIQLNENESALRKSDLDVVLAELDLRKWFEGEVVSERQKLELELDRAVRELDRLKEKYERGVQLESKGFLSRDELKRDELAYREALAAVGTARLNKRVYEDFQYPKDEKTKQSAVQEAKAEVERVKRKNASELASRGADRDNRREQLRLRESKLAKLRDQFEACTVAAPGDGLVVHATSLNRDRFGNSDRGSLEVGRQTTRNELLIVLPDTSEMVASVRVPESIAGRVRKGQPATIKIDAFGGKVIRGQVLSVGVLAESGGWRDPNLREYTVKILLDPDPAASSLKPSMRCEAEISLDRVQQALALPVQAVFSDGLVRFVYMPRGEGFARRPVRLGRRSDRFVEITAGFAAGERALLRQPELADAQAKEWNQDQLAAVGLQLNDEGKVVPVGGRPAGAGGGPGGTPGSGPAAVGGAAPGRAAGGEPRRDAAQPAPTANGR